MPCTWKTDLAMSRPMVVIDCMIWLLRIVGCQQAPTFMALTCRWRSRPQHQKQTFSVEGRLCFPHWWRRPCAIEDRRVLFLWPIHTKHSDEIAFRRWQPVRLFV